MLGSKSREIARLRAEKADLAEQIDTDRTNREQTAGGTARVAHRYSVLATVVAVHIVTAEEHDADISPASLRAAVERARIDLSIEYARAGRDGATQ
jgi:hypothetical protein